MKRRPFCRIFFFLLTVATFAASPIVCREVANQSKVNQIAKQEEGDSVGIVLKAPTHELEVGELVRLDASESDVDGLTWKIIPATPDFEVIEEGRRAFFSSRVPGSYLIIIAAAKEGIPFLKHHTLEIVGNDPTPPTPKNLTSKVRRWVKDVEDYDGKETHAAALAAVFRKLATAEDVSVDDMLEATATANTAVLGDNLEQWIPLLKPLGTELDAITEAGGLETREDYKTVWINIAEGIEKGV